MNSESPYNPPCPSDCSPTLNVTASCPTKPKESTVITGVYLPVGGYNDRTIYQNSKRGGFGNWWSMYFSYSKNQWIFDVQQKQVIVGEKSFGSQIENCFDKSGQFIQNAFEIKMDKSYFYVMSQP